MAAAGQGGEAGAIPDAALADKAPLTTSIAPGLDAPMRLTRENRVSTSARPMSAVDGDAWAEGGSGDDSPTGDFRSGGDLTDDAMETSEHSGGDELGPPSGERRSVGRGSQGMRRRERRRTGFGGRLVLLILLFGLAMLALEMVGRPVQLPVWVVAEVEARLNRALADALPNGALSLGGIEITVGDDWVPHLVLEDLRLLQPGGQTLLTLPETHVSLDPSGLLQGVVRAQSLRIVGARIALRRDRDGHFDLPLAGTRLASSTPPALRPLAGGSHTVISAGPNAGPIAGLASDAGLAGQGEQGVQIGSLAALFAGFDHAFALPALSHLTTVEVEALSLSLTDLRAGRSFEVGDGHLSIENRSTEIAAQLSMSLVAGGSTPAQAVFTAIAAKGARAGTGTGAGMGTGADTGSARVSVQVDKVAARDLAAQTPLLGWLAVLDAPISGRLAATVSAKGIEALDGRLDIAAGALQPAPKTTPIAFDHASLDLGYDQATGRIVLSDLSVQSRTLRLTTKGQAYMVDDAGQTLSGALSGRIPAAFVGQIAVAGLSVDPEGLFAAPVQFSQGAVDLRLKLDPFTLDIGQVSLTEAGEHLGLSGQIKAEEGGWRAAIDLTLNQISRDRLLAIWPLRLVSGTRTWVQGNIRNAELNDVHAAIRIAPGTEPKAELSYSFSHAELHFMPKMPPVTGAFGYSTIQGKSYALVMSKGVVIPPQGGPLDVAGSEFLVPDITQHPARAEIDLHMAGALTATLSLLDQPPFHYLQKSGQPVDLGSGRAELAARISLPLIQRVLPGDVSFAVSGTVSDFASDKLVKGHPVTAPLLKLAATSKGMTISGKGLLGRVPFDVTLTQEFPTMTMTPQDVALMDVLPEGVQILPREGPVAPARIAGSVTLSQAAVEEFGLGLPRGMVSGEAQADVTLDLPKAAPAELHLTSGLAGITLAIPDLGWRKAANAKGALAVDLRLGPAPEITRLVLSGAGLQATGKVTLRPDGGLDVARFDKVSMGGWLDGAVEISGRGAGRPVGLAVTSGTIDLRKFPVSRGSAGSGVSDSPLTLSLQALRISEGIRLSGFSGDFTLKGGFNGTFAALVNGVAPVTGTAVPTRNGTAVRLIAQDAGATMAAAGLFSSARGGDLDMTLIPRAQPGFYDGHATVRRIRVHYGSVMADLLSAISVIGLLDQLNGDGIVFDSGEAQFLLTPDAIEVQKGSAIGVSMGVSMEGVYHSDSAELNMRGVVSPLYLLNGIGSILTRKGEGLFGFAYRLTGTATAPDVSVNPLSILTPGMFRDLFRSAAPTIAAPEGGGGGGG